MRKLLFTILFMFFAVQASAQGYHWVYTDSLIYVLSLSGADTIAILKFKSSDTDNYVLTLNSSTKIWSAEAAAGAAGGDAWSDPVDSDILPTGNDNTYDLGSAAASFADIFWDGTATGNVTGALTGNASTATALAANGGNAGAGNAILGVDASGAAEGAFDVWTEAENTAAAYISATLTQEEVEDFAGGMWTGNTETLITITYQDGDGTIDAVVDNDLSNYDNSSSLFITPSSTDALTNKTMDAFTNEIDADRLHIEARNSSGATINIGDAVYISGYNVGQNLIEVSLADASVAGTMPAIGLVESSSIANNANGEIVISGRLAGFSTSSFSVGDDIYISETGTTGNTLTATKPTGTALIQTIGEVLRSHATLGILEIFGAGRTNDIPNIPATNFWVGNASAVATAVAMSGHATMDNAGALTIDHGGVDGLGDDDHSAYENELDNSAGLKAALSDETGSSGSGLSMFSNYPVFLDQNAAPSVAGALGYDNTFTGMDDGGFTWYDDDEIRLLIDLDASEALGSGDDQHVVVFNWNGGNGFFDLQADATGGNTAWDDISDPDNSGLTTITFDNAELSLLTGDNDAAASFFKLQNTDADHTVGDFYLLDLDYSADDGDANALYMKLQDSGGIVMTIKENGIIDTDGTITAGGAITATGSFIIGGADMNETDLEKLDGITNGTAAAAKALVLDAGSDITSGVDSFTATTFVGALTGNATSADHAGTITWTGTSILESGVAFQFGDASDATLTHTYANTGTNVTVAYSSALFTFSHGLTLSAGNITQAAGTTLFMGGLLDATGDVDMDYGSGDIDDHTFLTDGTGTAEIVLPAGAIDGTEILDNTVAVEDVQPELDNRTLSYSIIDTVKAGDLFRIHEFNYPVTIDSVVCNTDAGTVTFNIEHRAHTTPRSAGTDVLTSDIVADAYEASSTFNDNTIPANRPLYQVNSAVSGGADRCDVTIFYKID